MTDQGNADERKQRAEPGGNTPADFVDDAALLAAYRDGDSSALETLYERLYGMAVAHARRYATHGLEAEDIVSEAFAKVINAIHGGKGPTASLWWYLVTAMKSVALRPNADAAQSVAVEPDTLEFLSVPQDVPLGDAVMHPAVVDAFNHLPKRWQEVIWYREIEGLSLNEVGEALGMNRNAVGALLNRARTGLRTGYLSALASDNAPEECRPFTAMLPAYVANDLNEPLKRRGLEAHLERCEVCTTNRAELSNATTRLSGAIIAGVPALFVLPHASLVASGTEAAGSIFGHGAVSARAIGWSVASFAAAATMVTAIVLTSGNAGADPSVWQDETSSVPSVTTVVRQSEQSTPPGQQGDGTPTESRGERASAPVAGEPDRLMLWEAPTSGGVCKMFFEPAHDGAMAFFEQTTTGTGACSVEVSRPGGFAVTLDSSAGLQLVHASTAAEYRFAVTTDVAEAETFVFRTVESDLN
ncbi:sigma-70 family RNA polymerase sigma factor [Lysinibacter cavernae]|uniref:RNA polymerase sigma factor (Sigma-70 family) n=1 Tax=Lysinibacter cavernae TaxID=1640652 RepID=A0A7X5R1T0_9MICO|nr:sigma-70 family RNA polymerase sigma factor [Lysinibacter cavernae]NIH54134.1 RNA polymerase sigma factor (sigma-70 family) [Lysinibacter cavernae]